MTDPKSDERNNNPSMLLDLLDQVKNAVDLTGIDAINFSPSEPSGWLKPDVHMRIGDFEIKCLKPEKYNL